MKYMNIKYINIYICKYIAARYLEAFKCKVKKLFTRSSFESRNANFSRDSGRVGTRAGTRLQISDWLPTLLETQKIEECRGLSRSPQPSAEREKRTHKSIYRLSQRKRTIASCRASFDLYLIFHRKTTFTFFSSVASKFGRLTRCTECDISSKYILC